MNVLVIGSGGREHALVWKLRQSPSVEKIYCAPGNAGIANEAELVPVKPGDVKGLLDLVARERIGLTVVGPEQPLVDGLVDDFRAAGHAVFGPVKGAARLEGSKAFAKDFMARHGIPTAKYATFTADQDIEALKAVETTPVPMVVKADGLAAGKGVIVCESRSDARAAVEDMFVRKSFGAAGGTVVIEEFLEGEEASVFVITDGKKFALLHPAQDHKRALDGDAGKNTGGMGAYAPAPIVTPHTLSTVVSTIVVPTLKGMASEGTPYTGCLYVGLMITADGPYVLEYNCRFGDPETQVVIPLIDGDLAAILHDASTGALDPSKVKLHDASAVCVVVASQGYPDAYETGKVITGLENIRQNEGTVVFHAGTKRQGDAIVTSGGRVLGVTAVGYKTDLEGTIRSAYSAVDQVTFDGAYYRSDIGRKGLR